MKRNPISIGRPSVLRHANALNVLKLLREAHTCSRADLVRATGLSAPTITNVVNDLLAANLIEPLGSGDSSGGRPPGIIRFKAESACVLAVDITAAAIAFLLTDLDGNELTRTDISLARRPTTPEAICTLIREESRRLLKLVGKPRKSLIATAVGVPAITNIAEGIVLSISTLDQWRSVPLRAMLRKALGCMVLIENDTNLAAQGERYRGAARTEQNFILVSIGAGIGAGIVLDGRIHHGTQWSAGEIAYLRLPDVSRRKPTLHEFGELEAVLTESGIVQSWNEAFPAAKKLDATAILDLAQQGNPRARKLIAKRATMAADIAVNLSLILNPGLILFTGSVGSHPYLIDQVRDHLQQGEFAAPRVEAGALGTSAVLWGAIAVALEATPDVLLPEPTP